MASDCVSGVSGDELDGLRWRIEFKVFQSVRGLEDDSVTRFVRKLDLALETRDLTKLHWALNFLRSKGDFQRRPVARSQPQKSGGAPVTSKGAPNF